MCLGAKFPHVPGNPSFYPRIRDPNRRPGWVVAPWCAGMGGLGCIRLGRFPESEFNDQIGGVMIGSRAYQGFRPLW